MKIKQNKNNQPLVSVVITTKNEQDVIGNLLKSVEDQTYKNIEIILVDNNSTDKTVEVSKKYTNKIFNNGPERSAQRNYGVKESKGKYLLILDADMKLSNSLVRECVDLSLSNKSIGAIYIPEISVGERIWERVKAFERSFYERSQNSWVESARFFNKEAFNKAGGYDVAITGPEDWDLSESVRKLGFETRRTKSVIYHNERIPSLTKIIKKWYYYGLKAHRTLDKQRTGMINPKTIHFLRPEFYKQWKRIVGNPLMSFLMVLMLLVELISGGLGFLMGKIRNL